jgi:hypothetical protein
MTIITVLLSPKAQGRLATATTCFVSAPLRVLINGGRINDDEAVDEDNAPSFGEEPSTFRRRFTETDC